MNTKYIITSRLLISNFLTVFYASIILLVIIEDYVRNGFSLTQKLRLEPPSRLTDPRYGVHKYIRVNNINLHYVESGDPWKPLMLFVHGFPESWYSWRYQILEFQKDYRCIAIDARGYGDSDKPASVDAYKLDVLIEDVRDLIRQLGVEKVILVSHDWGGIIANRFREVYPEVLSATIVLGSSSSEAINYHIWNNAVQRKMSWYVFFFRVPELPELFLQRNDTVFFESFIVPGKTTIDQEDVECYKYLFSKPGAFTPPINYYRASAGSSKLPRNITIDVPLIVANAQNDTAIEPSILDVMNLQYSNIETVLISNVRHNLQQEEPVVINNLIRDFLMRHNL